ncbi:hypothetical protein ACHAPJ_005607 [Fusarium lateritium]
MYQAFYHGYGIAEASQIPRELIGAAQFYWNQVSQLQRDYVTDGWDLTDVWRVNLAFEECAPAWRAVAAQVANPYNVSSANPGLVTQIQTQELASQRELLALPPRIVSRSASWCGT